MDEIYLIYSKITSFNKNFIDFNASEIARKALNHVIFEDNAVVILRFFFFHESVPQQIFPYCVLFMPRRRNNNPGRLARPKTAYIAFSSIAGGTNTCDGEVVFAGNVPYPYARQVTNSKADLS